MSTADAWVLLATCNGARFLRAQLESILAQENVRLRILVRDDASTDETPALLEAFAHRHPEITLLRDGPGRLGHAANFSRLMQAALDGGTPCVLLSDQDDLWHPRRAAIQLRGLRALEDRFGEQTPCLRHGDMELIDAGGRRTDASFLRRHGMVLPAAGRELACLIAGNFATGCTMAFNRALLALAAPVPPLIRHHDHWLALCAAATGQLVCEDEPLVRYRQHGGNVVGGTVRLDRRMPLRLWRAWLRHREDRRRLPALLGMLRERCGPSITPEASRLLERAAGVLEADLSRLQRYRALRELGIDGIGPARRRLWLAKNLLP